MVQKPHLKIKGDKGHLRWVLQYKSRDNSIHNNSNQVSQLLVKFGVPFDSFTQ